MGQKTDGSEAGGCTVGNSEKLELINRSRIIHTILIVEQTFVPAPFIGACHGSRLKDLQLPKTKKGRFSNRPYSTNVFFYLILSSDHLCFTVDITLDLAAVRNIHSDLDIVFLDNNITFNDRIPGNIYSQPSSIV